MKDLLNAMFNYSANLHIGQETTLCQECAMHTPSSISINSNVYTFIPDIWRRSANIHNFPNSPTNGNLQQCALLYFKCLRIPAPCSVCRADLLVSKQFDIMPRIIVFHLGPQSIHISQTIVVQLNGSSYTYQLKGMIYFGSAHFTSQFIDRNNAVWYHDRIETGQNCEYQGQLHTLTNDALQHTHNKHICTAIYLIK